MGKIKEFLRLTFTKASKEPTVEELAEVAAKLSQADSLEALYLGAETFGVENPKGKILGVIDATLAFIKAGIGKLRDGLVTIAGDRKTVQERFERELVRITESRDEQDLQLRELAHGYSVRLSELDEELKALAKLRTVFAGDEEA